MDGGAASGELPQFLLGAGPIWNTSLPPLTMSVWLNQGLLRDLPFEVADWIYRFFSELLLAAITKSLPLPRWIVTSSKRGLPMMYSGRAGSTV